MATAAQPLTGRTLAQRVRAKYPGAYDDLDDVTLEGKILAKYPEYGDLPRTQAAPAEQKRGRQGVKERLAEGFAPGSTVRNVVSEADLMTAPRFAAPGSNVPIGEAVSEAGAIAAFGVRPTPGMPRPNFGALASDARSVARAGFKATENVRAAAGEKIAGPVVRKPPSATAEDLKFGRNPARAIVREPGLQGLTDQARSESAAKALTKLGETIDETLSTPQVRNRLPIDLEPIIEQARAAALASPKAKLNPGLASRINQTADLLKTEFGELRKPALEAAKFKRAVGDATGWTGQAFDNEVNQLLVDVYRGANKKINLRAPEVAGFNARYADLLSAKKAIDRNIAFNTNRPLSVGRALLGVGGGARGTIVGGVVGGPSGAALGMAADLAMSKGARFKIGRAIAPQYEVPTAPQAQAVPWLAGEQGPFWAEPFRPGWRTPPNAAAMASEPWRRLDIIARGETPPDMSGRMGAEISGPAGRGYRLLGPAPATTPPNAVGMLDLIARQDPRTGVPVRSGPLLAGEAAVSGQRGGELMRLREIAQRGPQIVENPPSAPPASRAGGSAPAAQIRPKRPVAARPVRGAQTPAESPTGAAAQAPELNPAPDFLPSNLRGWGVYVRKGKGWQLAQSFFKSKEAAEVLAEKIQRQQGNETVVRTNK